MSLFSNNPLPQRIAQTSGHLIHPAARRKNAFRQQFSRGARRRRAQVGNKITNRKINLMTNSRNDRQIRIEIARATTSSLNAQRSSRLPPPRVINIISNFCFFDQSLSKRIKRRFHYPLLGPEPHRVRERFQAMNCVERSRAARPE